MEHDFIKVLKSLRQWLRQEHVGLRTRGLNSIPTKGNIFSLEFLFSCSKHENIIIELSCL